jgi:hypothetical protein
LTRYAQTSDTHGIGGVVVRIIHSATEDIQDVPPPPSKVAAISQGVFPSAVFSQSEWNAQIAWGTAAFAPAARTAIARTAERINVVGNIAAAVK